jgi:hypothetical protein
MALVVLMLPVLASGAPPEQTPVQTPAPTPAPAAVQGLSDEELDLQTVLSEPDFTIGVLPTT